MALSSTEAEYMATTEACKEGIWLRRLYTDILNPNDSVNSNDSVNPNDLVITQLLRVDNQGSMKLAKNPKFHDRTKHIAVRHHFIREAIETNMISLEYIPTSENTADLLTKALKRNLHDYHMKGIGLRDIRKL